MPDFPSLVLVAAGGVAGGVARFLISGAVARRIGETFPWGTLVVNTSGAFLIGALAAWVGRAEIGGDLWITAGAGILGSYTTVSSFSLQTLALLRDREWPLASINVVGSLAACLAAVLVGYIAGGVLWSAYNLAGLLLD